MLTVKIVGTEDKKFKILVNRVRQAIDSLDAEATVEEITDWEEIIGMGIIQIPAIIIRNQVLSQGFLPNLSELKTLLKMFLTPIKKKYEENKITEQSNINLNENALGTNRLLYNSQRRL